MSQDNNFCSKVCEWPEKERPRERLLKHGPAALSDAQLLAILLRTGSSDKGVMDLAIGFLDTFKILRSIDIASIADLTSIKGVGTAKIAQIKAAFELGIRESAASSSSSIILAATLLRTAAISQLPKAEEGWRGHRAYRPHNYR